MTAKKQPPADKQRSGVRSAVRREQVLTAALDLFSRHGYAATSTARIAKAAGVAEGLVFHYFGTKEGLLLEVAARQNTFAGRALGLLGQSHESGRELLRSIADGLVEVSAAERAFIGFMWAEMQVNEALRTRVAEATGMVMKRFVEVLQVRVEVGELREDAPLEPALEGFLGGFMFFFGQHRHLSEAAWRKRATAFAAAWADICWRGLASTDALG